MKQYQRDTLYTDLRSRHLFDPTDTLYSSHPPSRKTPRDTFDTRPQKQTTYPRDTVRTHRRIREMFAPVDTADSSNREKASTFRLDTKHTFHLQRT